MSILCNSNNLYFDPIRLKSFKKIWQGKGSFVCANTYNFLLEGEYGFKVYLMHTFSLNRNPFSSLFCDKLSKPFLFILSCLFAFTKPTFTVFSISPNGTFVIILAHTLKLSSRQFVWGSSTPTPVLQQTNSFLKRIAL